MEQQQAFTASHPITKGLGADSAAFLTEFAMVQINDMDNMNKGFVARNGFNEGSGEHLCLGIFKDCLVLKLLLVNMTGAGYAAGLDATELIDYNLWNHGGVTNRRINC